MPARTDSSKEPGLHPYFSPFSASHSFSSRRNRRMLTTRASDCLALLSSTCRSRKYAQELSG